MLATFDLNFCHLMGAQGRTSLAWGVWEDALTHLHACSREKGQIMEGAMMWTG